MLCGVEGNAARSPSRRTRRGNRSTDPGSLRPVTRSRRLLVRPHEVFGLGQPRRQDPHQLRRRRRPDLRPRRRRVVHDRRQPESVRGRLLRPGQHRRDHLDPTVGGALGWAANASCAPQPVERLGRLREPRRDGKVGGRGPIPIGPTRSSDRVGVEDGGPTSRYQSNTMRW